MPKNNYPNATIDELPGDFIADSIRSLQELAAMGKISSSPDQDEEFEQRVAQIIEFCKEKKMRLGIETLCGGLGITSRQHWAHREKNAYGGVSERRQNAVKQVKQLIYAFLEQAGMSGKLSPVTYVWLSKNWMKYRDNVPEEPEASSHTTPDPPLGIADRLGRLGPRTRTPGAVTTAAAPEEHRGSLAAMFAEIIPKKLDSES